MDYKIVIRTVMVSKSDGGYSPDKWQEPEDFYEVHEVLLSGHSKVIFSSNDCTKALKYMQTQEDLLAGNICL